jgi:hypothetical protein
MPSRGAPSPVEGRETAEKATQDTGGMEQASEEGGESVRPLRCPAFGLLHLMLDEVANQYGYLLVP